LHYDLPLREDKTQAWYKTLEARTDRLDYTITYDNEPAGIIGLLNINLQSKDAEYYICVGEERFKGKGLAKIATDLLIKIAYKKLGIDNIYLYTEVDNVRAQKMFVKSGFKKRKLLKNDLFYNGKNIDRYLYNLNVNKYIYDVGDPNSDLRK